jgi:hypothetical protein
VFYFGGEGKGMFLQNNIWVNVLFNNFFSFIYNPMKVIIFLKVWSLELFFSFLDFYQNLGGKKNDLKK